MNWTEPIVSGYTIPLPDEVMVEIARVGLLARGTFDYSADVWAIRCMSRCLNRDGFWEWEPLPSSRDNDFKARTRFPLALANELARLETRKGNYPGGPAMRWKYYGEDAA